MLMVADFWDVETRGAGPRACVTSTRLCRRVDSRQCTHESLKSTGRGVAGPDTWSHVEGGAGV